MVEFLSIEDYTAFQRRAAEEALDALDRLDSQCEARHASQRVHSRHAFRGIITISVLQPGQSLAERDAGRSFRAWARSISQGGFSFISPSHIPETTIAVEPIIEETTIWRLAEIVRAREMPFYGFWEYGAAFLEEIQPSFPP